MRPVKKYLMRLNMEDYQEKSEEEKSRRFSLYLLKIGIKISQIVKFCDDPEKIKKWRRYVYKNHLI